jgi:uncharacterized protein (UPF0335 family)
VDMASAQGDVSVNKLNGLLLDAMNQSRALFHQLESQNETIERLRAENEQLRHEVESLKTRRQQIGSDVDVAAQLDHLFEQDAAKQAEIERLKLELRAGRKDRSRQRTKASQLASPHTSSDGVEHVSSSGMLRISPYSTPFHPPPKDNPKRRSVEEPRTSPAAKRARTDDYTGPLHELSDHETNIVKPKQDRKSRDRRDHGAEAILAVAEDGEDPSKGDEQSAKIEPPSDKVYTGIHGRLGALMSTTTPANAALARPGQRYVKSSSPQTPAQRQTSFSSDGGITGTSTKERPSGLRFLRPARHREQAAEDEEPLRSRPLSKLNLSHFKLNPAWTTDMQEVLIRDKGTKKCLPGCTRPECCGNQMRALAMTVGPDIQLSDDDLLLDFLGPGSEEKITNLTNVARDNLLHEARVKRAANQYGKLYKKAQERAVSPAGFWGTDIAGSQEVKQQREEARLWERAEVERRLSEATRQNGQWVFADEG